MSKEIWIVKLPKRDNFPLGCLSKYWGFLQFLIKTLISDYPPSLKDGHSKCDCNYDWAPPSRQVIWSTINPWLQISLNFLSVKEVGLNIHAKSRRKGGITALSDTCSTSSYRAYRDWIIIQPYIMTIGLGK